MICSPDGLIRYNDSITIVDDIPLLSQWIKNRQVETCRFLAQRVGFEPTCAFAQTDFESFSLWTLADFCRIF